MQYYYGKFITYKFNSKNVIVSRPDKCHRNINTKTFFSSITSLKAV